MQSRPAIIVYDNDAIKKWTLEIELTPTQIKNEETKCQKEEDQLKIWQDKASLFEQHLNNLINALERRKNKFYGDQLLKDKLNLEAELKQDREYQHLQAEIIKIKAQTQLNYSEIEKCRKNISLINDNITQLMTQRDFLIKQQIPEAEKFLADLRHSPEELYDQLSKTIINRLSDFDTKFDEQDDNMRLCFYQLQQKINFIFKAKTYELPPAKKESHVFPDLFQLYQDLVQTPSHTKQDVFWKEKEYQIGQLKYHQLCGFLWDLYHCYLNLNPTPNQDFLDLLYSLLEKTHIAEEGDLPNEMRIGINIQKQFATFKESHPEIYDISIETLNQAEKEECQIAVKKLQDYSRSGTTICHKKAAQLAKTVENVVNQPSIKFTSPESYKVYTRVITHAYTLYVNHSKGIWDANLFDRFVNLYDHVSGKPCVNQTVMGAIFAVVGSLIVVSSISVGVVTLGGSSVGSVLGISLGTAMLAGGASMLGGGFCLFSGRRQGVSKKMKETGDILCEPNKQIPLLRPV